MARIRGYVAASVDGYIATPDGGIDWLAPFDGADYGYDAFMEGIGTIVCGRTSFEQVLGFPAWPYAGKRVVVLSHRPPPEALPPDVRFARGDVVPLADELLRTARGDVWVMGGADVQAQFIRAGRLHALQLFVMPVLLGRGIPLFPPMDGHLRLELSAQRSFPNGVVELAYTLPGA